MSKIPKHAKKLRRLIKWMGWYPPYLGAGISVTHVSHDARTYKVVLKQRWYNRNIYGTHFGGSIYSMIDPFYVFSAYAYLGDGYILWDQKASIHFVRPGKGTIQATIHIPDEEMARIKETVDNSSKATFEFEGEILDNYGKTVATFAKTIYVRKKNGSN